MSGNAETSQFKLRILLIEDNPGDARLIREMLSESGDSGFDLENADRLSTGLAMLSAQRFDLVLLDLSLTDSRGSATYRKVRRQAVELPIVVLTGMDDESLATQLLREGAQDYLIKGQVDGNLLHRAIRYSIERKQMEDELRNTAKDLLLTVEELKAANARIVEQQKSVIEEERLKVLLQMAGATAHELNQPLTTLLGNIELIGVIGDDPEQLRFSLGEIEASGKRIRDIVKRIQRIRHYDTKDYAAGSQIIDFINRMKVLVVEDSDEDFRAIEAILKCSKGIDYGRAATLDEALARAGEEPFDLVLFDHVLPDGNTFDFLREMSGRSIDVPVVVVTGQGNEVLASQIIREGAYDYLPKNRLTAESLFRSMVNAVTKAVLKREIRKAQERLAEMATEDDLTGLYNRRYFMDALGREVARNLRYGHGLALCIMDLDHFKDVNDACGHPAGDMVLRELAGIIRKSFRHSDLCCRYGGDEFAVILPETGANKGGGGCERLRESVASLPFHWEQDTFYVTISIGVVEHRAMDRESAEDLIVRADEALFAAKRKGRNRVVTVGNFPPKI